jgi:hypothetical protein
MPGLPGQAEFHRSGDSPVVAEGIRLMWLGMLRIPVVEDLLLREFITGIAALLAVSKRHLRVSEGLHQAFQPIGIHRINMSAGYHNKLSVRFEDSLIQ